MSAALSEARAALGTARHSWIARFHRTPAAARQGPGCTAALSADAELNRTWPGISASAGRWALGAATRSTAPNCRPAGDRLPSSPACAAGRRGARSAMPKIPPVRLHPPPRAAMRRRSCRLPRQTPAVPAPSLASAPAGAQHSVRRRSPARASARGGNRQAVLSLMPPARARDPGSRLALCRGRRHRQSDSRRSNTSAASRTHAGGPQARSSPTPSCGWSTARRRRDPAGAAQPGRPACGVVADSRRAVPARMLLDGRAAQAAAGRASYRAQAVLSDRQGDQRRTDPRATSANAQRDLPALVLLDLSADRRAAPARGGQASCCAAPPAGHRCVLIAAIAAW